MLSLLMKLAGDAGARLYRPINARMMQLDIRCRD